MTEYRVVAEDGVTVLGTHRNKGEIVSLTPAQAAGHTAGGLALASAPVAPKKQAPAPQAGKSADK